MSPATDGDYALSAYLRRIIERDREPRPTTRGLYLRGVRIHIDPHRSPRPMSAISTYGTGHWEQVACRPWRTRMAIVQPQPVIGNVDGKGRPAAAICFLRTHYLPSETTMSLRNGSDSTVSLPLTPVAPTTGLGTRCAHKSIFIWLSSGRSSFPCAGRRLPSSGDLDGADVARGALRPTDEPLVGRSRRRTQRPPLVVGSALRDRVDRDARRDGRHRLRGAAVVAE